LESIIYREKVWIGKWTSIAFGMLIGVFIPLIALQIFAGSREPYLLGFYLAFDLFFFIVFINFRRLDLIIYPSRILVSFGLIRKVISMSDVISCEPVRASLGVYAGYGIRYGGDGSLAFTTSFGDAVKLLLRHGRPFVFSTNRQREVIETIQKIISAYRRSIDENH